MQAGKLLALWLPVLLVLGACNKNKNVDPPAELTGITSRIDIDRVWDAGMEGEPRLRLGLGVAADATRAFAAGTDGEVAAFDLRNGREVWRVRTRVRLAGGPGAGSDLVAVGGDHGDVVVLDAASGGLKWKARINSEILAAPAIGTGVVVVRSVDGRLHAFDAAEGKVLWTAEQQVPRLSLRGTGKPVIVGDLVVCGFDNGRLLAINLRDGNDVWETQISPPAGRTELERLVDVDSAVHAVDDDIYAVSFQGRIARLARDTGQVWWSSELSSYRGLDTDEDGVYVSTAEGEVVKIGRRTGVELWRSKALAHRRLSAPAVMGRQVAVADLEGYVHWLDVETGDIVGRSNSGGERVSAPPRLAGDTLLVLNDKGHLTAFRITPRG